jgi:lipopolysaccharide heptosyltransferase I
VTSTPPPRFATPPQRVLIIKPSAIGDVVHALPVLNLIRRGWPAARVSWLVTPTCAGLIEGHPQLHDIILFDRKRFGRALHSVNALHELRAFNRSLKSHQFDLVIDLQGLFRSGWMSWRTHAPVRVGGTDSRELAWLFHTHRADVDRHTQHAVDRYLDVADFLGLGRDPIEFIFPTDDHDRRAVDEMLAQSGAAGEPIAVLLPASNWPTKQWATERFAGLVRPLRERLGLRAVLAGGPDAAAIAPAIPDTINFAGKTTLRQLVALLERTSLVIANDTGPMHVAAALNRPLVTVFGPTSPLRTGPYQRMDSVVRLDIACSPCFARTCWHHSCLRGLGIDPVIEACARQLSRATTRRTVAV